MITIKFLRETGKRRFSFIPTLCTLFNALFGFLAVVKALEGDFLSASYCIVCAALMDMIDGRIARFFGLTSAFGMELDSLCDAVSFCCVPVIVMYCWCLHTQGFLGFLILALYLWCGLFRLASFNLITVYDAKYFIGLPTTFSALCLASLLANTPFVDTQVAAARIHCFGSMLIMTTLAVLMVSTLRFPSFKRMPSGITLKIYIAAAIGLGAFVVAFAWPLKLVVPYSYVIVSSACDVYQRIQNRYMSKKISR